MSNKFQFFLLFSFSLLFVGFMSLERPGSDKDEEFRMSAAMGYPFIVSYFSDAPKEVNCPKLEAEKIDLDENLLKFVKYFEGFEPTTTYDMDGAYMIGYGFRKEDIPNLKWGDTITKEKSHEILIKIMEKFGKIVDKTIKVPITGNQRNAMTSFSYNIGPNAFKKSFVVRETNKKNYKKAADCFRYWCRANGRILNGLKKRRAAEKEMYLKEVGES